MSISKLQAAQKQLDCAIRLLFQEDDIPSTITLSRAAFRILFDIYPVHKPQGDFTRHLDGLIQRMGWNKFNEIANQLKHADRDAAAILNPNHLDAMVGIGLATVLYHSITGSHSVEMRAFEIIMSIVDPDFAEPHDLEAEGYADFTKAVKAARNASHHHLMVMARGVLHEMKTSEVLKQDPTITR